MSFAVSDEALLMGGDVSGDWLMDHRVDETGSLVIVLTGWEADALRRQMKHWEAADDPEYVAGQLFEILDSDLPLSYREFEQ